MKRYLIIIAMGIIGYPIGASAVTGFGIGAKIGSSEYKGNVLPESRDVGSGRTWGIILLVGSAPVVDFELRASYFDRDVDYTYPVGAGSATATYRFQDASGMLVLKRNLIAPIASPLALYIGAGAGVHWLNTEYANAAAGGTVTVSDDPLAIAGSLARPSGAGIAGLKLSSPGIPLQIFGEVSYEMIFATERIAVSGYSGGLMLSF